MDSLRAGEVREEPLWVLPGRLGLASCWLRRLPEPSLCDGFGQRDFLFERVIVLFILPSFSYEVDDVDRPFLAWPVLPIEALRAGLGSVGPRRVDGVSALDEGYAHGQFEGRHQYSP